jgi:hypothetical protein
MDKKIVLWIISLALIALGLAILLPGGRVADKNPKLPWEIRLDAQGNAEVFGLKLGDSSLDQAKQIFQDAGKSSLFITREGAPVLEAYFERIYLSGLKADFVLVMEAEETLLQEIYDRGSRISRTTETTRKVDLTEADQQLVGHLPIQAINYIPAANLDDELILARFGEPAERIVETQTGIVHWIYPERGLSIGVNPEGKELLQYVQPREIDRLVQKIRHSNQSQLID